MDINTFLLSCAEAKEAEVFASDVSGDDLGSWQEDQRGLVWQDWGLADRREERAAAPEWTVTGSLEQETHIIERGWYEPSAGLVITANLYRPHHATGAAMVYLCGHHPDQKVWYQDHARRLAQLGFTTLIVDTVQHGEVPGTHHGMHGHGAFHWVSRGYSPAAVEAWAAVRGFDLLGARPEVDPDRIGVTGHSGGGAVSWWAAVLEPRIRAVVTSSGTLGEASQLADRTVDTHCDCYFPTNPRGTGMTRLLALVAPRPVLVLAPRFDLWCEFESAVAMAERLGDWYAARTGEQWPLEVFGFNAEHTYTAESRRRAFGWLVRHVRDADSDDAGDADGDDAGGVDRGGPADDPSDIDGVRLAADQLRVLGPDQIPDGAANATVQDWLIPPRPEAPHAPATLADLVVQRCFAFTDLASPLSARISRRYWRRDTEFFDLRYDAEPGWPVEAVLRRPRRSTGPVTVTLLDRESPRPSNATVTAAELTLAVRGTGRTAWHPGRDWHLRRSAAMLGRPIGAMRVVDVVRGLRAHRELFGTQTFTLLARREMAFPALLAALLDPRVTALQLTDLPRSLDLDDHDSERSDADGLTVLPQAEITGLLRIADVGDILEAVGSRAEITLN